MSLFDIDKNSEDRGNPTPNTHDKLIDGAIKSHKTLSTHYTTDADTNTGRLQMQNKQVLGNDGTTNTTLYGYNQALSKWGLFVTKPGIEVTTNTDLSQFIFNSSQDVFKIVASGSTVTPAINTFSSSAGTWSIATAQTSIPHNLGFVPIPLGFLNISNSYEPLPYTTTIGTGTNSSLWYMITWSLTTDATNLYISVWASVYGGSTAASSLPFRYYLLQETAN